MTEENSKNKNETPIEETPDQEQVTKNQEIPVEEPSKEDPTTEEPAVEESAENPVVAEAEVETGTEEKGGEEETPAEEPVVETPAEEPATKEEPIAESKDVVVASEEEEDDDDWWKDEDEYSTEERLKLEKLYNSTLREFHENEIVLGKVSSIGDKEVLLNIGFKSEGVVPVSEFRDMPELGVGNEVEVFIESVEDQNGQLLLSRRRAKHMRAWELINSSQVDDAILEGVIMRRTKGGFVVDLMGIEAFLPGSQIDVKPVRDFEAYVGKTMDFKVVKINHAYENVVVSHKVLIEEKLQEQRREILKNLEIGQVLEGTVKNMTNFGVFIDLGGVDGLLHITDISWGRINHPEEVLELDQKVNVAVLDFDNEKNRISLGMKQLTPHPWESLPEDFIVGSQVKGRVVTVADYGVFLEILPGVEGLIHTSEMSWSQHVRNPNEVYKVNDELEAVVLSLDRDDRKMSLGIKQLLPDPWESVPDKYPMGSTHTGIVRNMTNYGLFVELEEGVDGLVHISDLSWTKKYNHPSEFVKVGENLEVVVLEIDQENRRLSLGHKQLTEDVWITFESIFTEGTTHKGTVKRIDVRGATVELDYGVEGHIPSKHLKVEKDKPEIKVDDHIDLVVIDFNKDAKKLTLSHTRTWKEMEEPKKQTRRKQSPRISSKAGTTSLGDLDVLAELKAKMESVEQGSKTKAKPKAKKKAEPKEEKVEEVVEAKVEETATEVVEETKAKEVVEEKAAEVEEKAEEVVEAVEEVKEEAKDAVEETAEVAEEAAEEVVEAVEEVKEEAQDAVEETAEVAEEATEEVVEAVEEAKEEVEAADEEVKAEAEKPAKKEKKPSTKKKK